MEVFKAKHHETNKVVALKWVLLDSDHKGYGVHCP